jgi:hypothetical protein
MLGDEIGAVAEFPRTRDSNCEWTLLNRGSVSPINKFSGSHHPQEAERGALTTGLLIPPPQTHLFFATAAYLLTPRPVGPFWHRSNSAPVGNRDCQSWDLFLSSSAAWVLDRAAPDRTWI